jgi:CRP/FNR family transcriptional regulator/CRP/FNR family cyclic AMP-dependent transcriptional regulator
MESISLLKNIPLFASLRNNELANIQAVCIKRSYRKSQPILLEDDSSINTMFIIIRGKVKVSVVGPEGREAILAILKDGDFFGEISIIDGEPRSATVISVEDSELLLLKREELLEQISQNPRLALSLLIEFSKRLRRADKQISNLALLSVYGRVAGILLQLSEERGERKKDGLIVIENRPTHQEIADMSGTTRETVTRILSKLQKAGAIVIEKKSILIMREEVLKGDEN